MSNNITGNEVIHQYLRHNKKFPHVLCAGCGHGIVLGTLIRSIHSLDIPKDDVVVVAGIGCSGRLAVYVDFNTVHTTHGRALSFATGIKMANPKLNVITIMGDGDALSIGGNHLIHAARRNIGVTALVLNNNIYGMTGGQMAPTTMLSQITTTTPAGRCQTHEGMPIRMTEIMATLGGVSYAARGSLDCVKNIRKAKKYLKKAFEFQTNGTGFGFVELLSGCPTNWKMTPLQANERIQNEMIPYFPLGVYKDVSEEGGVC